MSNTNTTFIGANGFSPNEYIRARPEDAASLLKATTPLLGGTPTQTRNLQQINTYMLRQALLQRAVKNRDNLLVMNLLPDLKLCSQITVSSMLSPKDYVSKNLIYTAKAGLFKPKLQTLALDVLRKHFEEDYPIKKDLYNIVEDALVKKGSKPIAVIPENAIDAFINQGTTLNLESMPAEFNKLLARDGSLHTIGFLGSGKDTNKEEGGLTLRLESHHSPGRVSASQSLQVNLENFGDIREIEAVKVLDNVAAFSLARLNERARSQAADNLLANRVTSTGLSALTLESYDNQTLSIRDIERNFYYRNRPNRVEVTARLPGQEELTRKSVGKPVVIHFPPESVMPAHEPGNPKKQVAFFVMLDQNGHAIEMPDSDNYNQSLGGVANNDSRLQSSLIRRVEANLGQGNSFDMNNQEHLTQMTNVFGEIIERDLINRVKNGLIGQTVALANLQEISRVMLARTLAKKQTQLLYIPAEYMTYIAFDYDDRGLGKSILDEQSATNGKRVALLFAEVMAAIKNSIGRKRVEVQLDGRDINPGQRLEQILDEIVRSNSYTLPLNGVDPYEIMNQVNRAGYIFNITGHKGLPDMKIDITEFASQHQEPDSKLRDSLKDSSAMGFGLSPEMVSKGNDPEFATTIANHHLMYAQRVRDRQEIFSPQLTDHLRKYAKHDDGLIEKLKKLLEENADDLELTPEDFPEIKAMQMSEEMSKKYISYQSIVRFILGFNVELPSPSNVTDESQKSDIDAAVEYGKTAIDALFPDDAYSEANTGKFAEHLKTIKALLLGAYMRKQMSDKGLVPEIMEIMDIAKSDLRLQEYVKSISDQTIDLMALGNKYLTTMKPITTANDNDFIKNKISAGEGGFSSDSGSSDTGFDAGGFGGDSFGSDDLGGMPEAAEATDTTEPESAPEASGGEDDGRDATNNDPDPTAP